MKKNWSLVLAFGLPLLLVIVVALFAVLPRYGLKPNYNFIYASCDDENYYYEKSCNDFLNDLYSVVDGKLVKSEIEAIIDPSDSRKTIDESNVHLFLHDVSINESREIAFDDVKNLKLDGLITDKDGVSVEGMYNRSPEVFPIIYDSSSSYDYYLTKGKKRTKLNLINEDDRYYYRSDFEFIGWVID